MWEKTEIITDKGERVEAISPVIISASRSTDISAFYTEWFFNRLERGYLGWINPFNGKLSYISFAKTRLIVFWTKDAAPLLPYLPLLQKYKIDTYIQFTLNDYEKEGYEPNLPSLEERIANFQELSSLIGKEKVIWRNDPLFLTDCVNINSLLEKAKRIGDAINPYTKRMVFSFADITNYRKVLTNLKNKGINFKDFTEQDVYKWAEGLYNLNKDWELELRTCAEGWDMEQFGILPGKCIDDELILTVFPDNKELIEYIQKLKTTKKDKGQRSLCGCIPSKSIGDYNTCPHLCVYCYANGNPTRVMENFKRHQQDKNNELLLPLHFVPTK
ncbi:MAG: DUF1848 domain-containing protein [Odoribacter sp.]|nr:DUF1848 domain-containing protein [Odoribacter sp.]